MSPDQTAANQTILKPLTDAVGKAGADMQLEYPSKRNKIGARVNFAPYLAKTNVPQLKPVLDAIGFVGFA